MKTPQYAPPPTHQATLSQALPQPRQETSRRLSLAPSQGNFLFPSCPVPAQSCDPGLHPLKTSQAVSQQLRGAGMVDVIAKLARRQSRALRAQVRIEGRSRGQAQPLTG